MAQNDPIFITGPDRSGTSLMFALLAAHPNISMVRRSNMFRWFYGQFGELSQPENFESCLETMLRYKRLQQLQPDPERIRREFWQGEPTYGNLFSLFHTHHAQRNGKSRWGDKSLHTEHAATDVFKVFPQARIIHMVRDPRDRYASVAKRYTDRQKGLASITGRWISSINRAQHNVQQYPERYRLVRYETLASAPEETCKSICLFIGEAYSPEMLNMQSAPNYGDVGGNSSFGKFTPGTISTRSIGRFRQVVSQQAIAFMQICARKGMATFNYPLEPISLSSSEQARFYLVDLPITLTRMTTWLTLNKFESMKGQAAPSHRLSLK